MHRKAAWWLRVLITDHTKAQLLGPDTPLEQRFDIVILAVANNESAGRHPSNQLMELIFNGRKVCKDVGVIKFKVVEDQGSWMVVQKF